MATLTNEDFTFYKHALRQDATAKTEMQSAELTKVQWKAAIQAIEDWYEADRLVVKGLMETASGVTLTNQLAKKLAKVWMKRKWEDE
ncbi:MAG: hypothetical protein V3W09_04365 [Nitrososphaerales archaeon]